MREVIEAIDGPIALNRCLLKEGECEEEELCPIHQVWSKAQQQLLEILDQHDRRRFGKADGSK